MATLLIVEDDKQTNEAISEYLKSAGHKIIPAYDGADALQLFNEGNIDLSKLTFALAKENCEVLSVQEHDESLENYYVGLIGGRKHE